MKILCIADIHSNFAAFQPNSLPAADMCLIAGDITEHGLSARNKTFGGELSAARSWLGEVAARQPTFVVAGNHDIGIRNEHLEGIPGVVPLIGRRAECLGFSLHGVSISPVYAFPRMARLYDYMTVDPAEEAAAFEFEPVDIILSHCPPYAVMDRMADKGANVPGPHLGSEALLRAIRRDRPRLVVCGHVHNQPGRAMIGRTLVVNAAKTSVVVEI